MCLVCPSTVQEGYWEAGRGSVADHCGSWSPKQVTWRKGWGLRLDLFHVTKSRLRSRERSHCSPPLPEGELQKLARNSSEGITRDNSQQPGMFKPDIRKKFSRKPVYTRFTRWVEESPDLDVFKTLLGKAMAFLWFIIYVDVYALSSASVVRNL